MDRTTTNSPTPGSAQATQQIIKKQTDALQRVRRAEAILGGGSVADGSSLPATNRHRALFGID
jgi:hypothetical protein